MAVNLLDHLIDDCEDPTSYPTRLRYTHLLAHTLQRYEELLNEQTPYIFSAESDYWKIQFWDNHHGRPELPFSAHDCTSLENIQNYLWCDDREDPVCRHVFIEAEHSLAPLDCSREMLTSLFSFHQVMPQFLDIVLSFGALRGRSVSTAIQHCIFQFEHLIDLMGAQQYNIPQLGRSGWEIRHCYNLWSVEKTDHGKCPWAIRQAGVYHSFDIKMGKATWIHIKANDVLQKRIKEATTSGKYLQVEDRQTVHASFAASLSTHLVVFEWCSESWRQYLNHWECELVEILTKVKEAPIKQAAEALQKGSPDSTSDFLPVLKLISKQNSSPVITRSGTMSAYTPPRKDANENVSISSPQLDHQRRVLTNLTGTTLMTVPATAEYTPQNAECAFWVGEINPFQIFNEFKLHDLQHLYVLRTKFQEADMILKLNADILAEILGFYQHYVGDVDTPDIIKDRCRTALSSFTQRTNKTIAELQSQRTRIATMVSLLEDGKSLFDAIINFKNMELSRFSSKRVEGLTEEMHQSTLQMKTIAEKTEEETASMHTITIVTLVFLPGTFVATFLGAGFYQWPDADEASTIPDYPVWRPSFFYLFLKISLALTIFALFIWVVPRVRRWVSRGREGRCIKGDEEAQYPGAAYG